MTWVKVSDDADQNQQLAVAAHQDGKETSFDEIFAFIVRAYDVAARNCKGQVPTYEIPIPALYSPWKTIPRIISLIDVCKKAKLIEKRTKKIDGVEYIKLVLDENFISLYNPDDKRNANDNRNDRLIAPMLLRDGSNCRWCGVFVYRRPNRSNANDARQTDHLFAASGDEETKVSDIVVSCNKCNKRKGKPDQASKSEWGLDKLIPEPHNPRFAKEAVDYLTEKIGYNIEFYKADGRDNNYYYLTKESLKVRNEMIGSASVGATLVGSSDDSKVGKSPDIQKESGSASVGATFSEVSSEVNGTKPAEKGGSRVPT